MDKTKMTIAVMMRDINSDFSELMYNGLYDASKETDTNLVYLLGPQSPAEDQYYDDNDIDDEYVDQLDSIYDYAGILKPDALIIVSGSLKPSRVMPDINALVERYKDIPMLVLETVPVKPSVAYQVADSYQAMCECVEHLIVEHGCTFIVYVSGNPAEYDFKERLRAFRDTMNAHALDYNEDQIIMCDSSDSDERRISALFDDFPYVDAVVCSCDKYARIVYRACNRRGINVGTDVAVTGFDDVGMSHGMTPELTGVMYNSYSFGYEALKRAIRVAKGERIGGLKMPCHFVKRCSCGCPESRTPKRHEGGPAPVDDIIKQSLKDYVNKALTEAVDSVFYFLPYESVKADFKRYYSEFLNYINDSMFTEWDDMDEIFVTSKRYISILSDYKDISFRMVSDQTTEILENMMYMFPYGKERSKLLTMMAEIIKMLKEAEIVRMRKAGNLRREQLWFIPLFTKDLLDRSSRSEVDVLTLIMKRLKKMNVKSVHFFITNKPVIYKREGLPPTPDKLHYSGYFDGDERHIYLRQNSVCINSDNGISSILSQEGSHRYVAFSICSANRQYGIMLYEVDMSDIFFAMMCTLQIGALFHFRDISEMADKALKEVQIKDDMLGYVSDRDDLTGILNGCGFMKELMPLVSRNEGAQGYLLFADVCHITEINNTYGHENGDNAIKAVAERLGMILGEENLLARIGGDEYVSVILSENYDMIDSIRSSVDKAMNEYNLSSDEPYELEVVLRSYHFICEKNMDVAGLMNSAALSVESSLKSKGSLKMKKK